MSDRATPDDPVNMSVIFGMFVVDMVIYGLITWYVDAVKPGQYGVAKKWYFPVQKSYWCATNNNKSFDPDSNSIPDASNDELGKKEEYFEDEPDGQAGIRVKGLEKTFKSRVGGSGGAVMAVRGVSFSAIKGHITALLGHNGAGKTTTMSVLTGMYSPSGGTAFINGHDIRTDMAQARKSLGLCPQHNMLFTDLNVVEHFLFFGMVCEKCETNPGR